MPDRPETVVLLVNGDPRLSETVRAVVDAIENCRCDRAVSPAAARQRLTQGDVGLVIARLAERSGKDDEVLRLLPAATVRSIPIVIVIERESPELRLELLELGAADCLPLPLNVERLAFLVDILTLRPRWLGMKSGPGPIESNSMVDQFVVVSDKMRRLVEQFRQVAPLETTVMLTGETGCGKTNAAQLIHAFSSRSHRPFVVVQCGSLSPTLVESELFGHVRGAFTGADRDYAGKFATAEDGTLFLDEIDSVPRDSQAKLLRAVDERVYESVGSTRQQPLRARLIVATNRSLEDEVAEGRFRSDLYYRLNVVTFNIPPLRERREAIRPLAERFLDALSEQARRKGMHFSQAAVRAMESYAWPGNIRELRNAVERAVALSRGPTIDPTDLPETLQQEFRVFEPVGTAPLVGGNRLAVARRGGELQRLIDALERHHHNRTNTAAELGISRVTLYKKLHQYGLL
jgi:two-component system response regulator HydG